jgi:hypothetical protein
MKKLKLLVVNPNDTKESIYLNLLKYLKEQGIKVVDGRKNEK